MPISKQFLESLLYEEEGTSLDFKIAQYPFEHATKEEKSELLKDILAFINAWRRTDAYILVGVEEIKGGKSKVKGVNCHLDDAQIQQFVKDKVQRPIQLSYNVVELEETEIGVIHIPIQERPVFFTRDYGKLKKDVVYIRRGSSTDEASPEEIAQIGKAVSEDTGNLPLLELEFIDPENSQPLGVSIEIEVLNLSIPSNSEIPDNKPARPDWSLSTTNKNYYREYANFIKKNSEVAPLKLKVHNAGSRVAQGVRVKFFIKDPNGHFIFRDPTHLPNAPKNDIVPPVDFVNYEFNPDIDVQSSSEGWYIIADLGKIQAKDSETTGSSLFIGAYNETEIEMYAQVFADNLSSPQKYNLYVYVKPKEKSLTLKELLKHSK